MEEKKFDANSIIGFLLLGAIMLWFMYTNQPEEQIEEATSTEEVATQEGFPAPTEGNLTTQTVVSDSIASIEAQKRLGSFAYSAGLNVEQEGTTVIENDVLKLTVANKGGQIVEALVKNYKSYDSLPLYLIKDANASFNLNFGTTSNRTFNTKDLVFQPNLTKNGENSVLSMRLKVSESNYLEYRYELKPNNYMVGFAVRSVGLGSVINSSNKINLNYQLKAFRHEKSMKYENQMTALIYEKEGNKKDDLSISGDDSEQESQVSWFAFKQHFFSTILIAETPFKTANLASQTLFKDEATDKVFTKNFEVSAPIELNNGEINNGFSLFIGPNDYSLLSSYDKNIENVVDLGWGIFGWINKHAFIPLFNLLGGLISNYGLVIILMTIVVRIFMSPLVYKSYLSSARMKVLKPEMTAINEKYPGKDNAMKRQQETMALQRKAGVSMMAGCIPALLQMPVFFALFRFFPAAIDLRQQGFLWADDLSSYDSVFQLPFTIPFYGDHVSLFPILASVAIFFYMRMSQSQQMNMQQPAQEGMPDMQKMMKMMMYFSPIMMLVFFNSYGSGLSLYYFVSNLLTITIMLVIKNFIIDEDKIHAQIQENKKRPEKKKGKFRQRMDDAMKQAQEQQKVQQKQGKKKK
ncbi:membrane protein insertase YidC [Flavicella sp.]|uniref:membrane protein insertase YidC n=1 Tax=Flavicella sp. TaxID=2957742 RepID=UPI00262BA3FE|nr:membrane protein insertase YidC [Flavicella sp.]MDG1805101.1 membrane protein insertase YidC [Flavicella sp.]